MKTYASKPFQAKQFTDPKDLPSGIHAKGCLQQMPTTFCWADVPHYHSPNRQIIVVKPGQWIMYRKDKVVGHIDDTAFKADFEEVLSPDPFLGDESA